MTLTNQQVAELNEKYGWFTFGDAQSDVSRAFASDAIAKHEQIRNASQDLLAALICALNAMESCNEGDYSTGTVIDPSFDKYAIDEACIAAMKAIAKATGEQA